MGLTQEHDLHRRRRSRNVGLGLVLAAFIALTFGLTMVKISQGSVLTLSPPLVIRRADLDRALDIVERAIRAG